MLIKKIIVAEDDDSIAHMVNMALGDAGYLCLRARNGQEAFDLVRMHAPDLLILDVMMPHVDGIEVARRLKSDVMWSKTPILMLTALGTVDNKVEGFDAGADDYMVKPFDLRELAARVRALIRTTKREQERNPTTGLPGSGAIELQVEEILSKGDDCAVLHFDLREFDNYADAVGYAKAEELVAELGQIILDKTRAHSGGSAFVGHLGGVDFIALTGAGMAENLAGDVIAAFEDCKASWIDGVMAGDNGLIPGDAMTIAGVSTEDLSPRSSEEISRRLAAAMRAAKHNGVSGFISWTPDLE